MPALAPRRYPEAVQKPDPAPSLMLAFRLLLAAALLPFVLAQAQPCLDRVHLYENAPRLLPGDTLSLRGTAGGALLYIGAEHTRDPEHPLFARIDGHFVAFRPTVVFYEGPDRGVRGTREATIRETSESGYARFLAQGVGARIARLEPSPPDQFTYVADSLGAERAGLFFVLREAARLRDRESTTGEALHTAIAGLLEQAAPLGLPIPSLDSLDTLYRRHVAPSRWEDMPVAWFDPGLFSDEAHFFPAANRASSHFRNLYMAQVLAESVKEGARVLAVVGRNHLPMQADALRCLLTSQPQ